MPARILTLVAAAVLAAVLGQAPVSAQAQGKAALTGKVSSAAEGAMEGVVVRAKKGIVTVSVVSNDKGEFSFPAGKLGAGEYAVSIKATGYDLEGGAKSVTLKGDAPVSVDLKL